MKDLENTSKEILEGIAQVNEGKGDEEIQKLITDATKLQAAIKKSIRSSEKGMKNTRMRNAQDIDEALIDLHSVNMKNVIKELDYIAGELRYANL